MGYAGHGVAMSTWLGARVGEKLAGGAALPEMTGPFRAVPFYGGRPWFLPLIGAYYPNQGLHLLVRLTALPPSDSHHRIAGATREHCVRGSFALRLRSLRRRTSWTR